MPESEVLTLSEAAIYLRVSEAALEVLATDRSVPAQRIDGEWRFLKRALNGWLINEPVPRRGSKEAVLKHAGIFADDNDLEEQLAKMKTIRDAGDSE